LIRLHIDNSLWMPRCKVRLVLRVNMMFSSTLLQGMVLLKNDNTLPWSSVKNLAVIGPNANDTEVPSWFLARQYAC
jgi:hypothetical protein